MSLSFLIAGGLALRVLVKSWGVLGLRSGQSFKAYGSAVGVGIFGAWFSKRPCTQGPLVHLPGNSDDRFRIGVTLWKKARQCLTKYPSSTLFSFHLAVSLSRLNVRKKGTLTYEGVKY